MAGKKQEMPFLDDRKERIIRRLFEASDGNIVAMQRNADAARARAEQRNAGDGVKKRTEG